MPRYTPQQIEPKWQRDWEQNETFVTPTLPNDEGQIVVAGRERSTSGKMYVLDMFPYPSGEGLHVGHPEGYTATDIVCRFARMRGKHVLHPMGWDAFGLPAEQHAFRTGTHPAETTRKNTDNFRRQLQALGFSYDWSREIATTDEAYFRWTQWIFLQLFDTWYDREHTWTGPDGRERTGRGRPISELPIPEAVAKQGEAAVRRYQDEHRLAYQSQAPVNWCPALGTVLANEEVDANGRSEQGGHPVERVPLRQWMLRITAYGDRLADELDDLTWPDSIKALQRNWIGRSTGAEVDFFIGDSQDETIQRNEFTGWAKAREATHFPRRPGDDVLRVYTTRPDTLYGATYMVLAPEHRAVDRITPGDFREAVEEYRAQAARKSDLDRTDLAKEKTGVFTGAYAVNPVTGRRVPIWIADYVLASYGTGAIMAVPAHDVRDFEFAATFDLPIVPVVKAPGDREPTKDETAAAEAFPQQSLSGQGSGFFGPLPFAGQGTAINSKSIDGQPTAEAKATVTSELASRGLGREAVNYRLRDWLFSRQHFWGEPFPIWHELDDEGNETGLLRVDEPGDLPVRLPEQFDFTSHAKNKTGYEPPLAASPDSWLYKTAEDGTKLKRETNSMPQWAGSCWYYLRYLTPENDEHFVDPAAERYWMPVDLYVGGAEHAVLHLLYARFWHKVLFDRGLVSTAEPFARLINQGMILGEPETHGYRVAIAPDPLVAGVLRAAASRIEAVGGVSEDRSPDDLAARVKWEDELDSQDHTTLYASLRRAIRNLEEPPVTKEAIDQHAAMQRLRDAIRKSEPQCPETNPICWFNNQQGIRPILDRLETTAAEAEAGGHRWVSAEHVRDDEHSDSGLVDAEGHEVELVTLAADEHTLENGSPVLAADPTIRVVTRSHKMSKSRGNVVNPDEIVESYGADALRLYEMFMGPLEQSKPWSMSGVEGVARFLGRVWRLVVDDRAESLQLAAEVTDEPPSDDHDRLLHRTIAAVTRDIEVLSFNTAISRMMEFTNELGRADTRSRHVLEPFLLLLAPFAPHLAEELWQVLGHDESLAYEPWPEVDEAKLVESTVELPVQVNGKLRGRLQVPAGLDADGQIEAARADDGIATQLEGKTVVKTISIPGRMVNFVVKK